MFCLPFGNHRPGECSIVSRMIPIVYCHCKLSDKHLKIIHFSLPFRFLPQSCVYSAFLFYHELFKRLSPNVVHPSRLAYFNIMRNIYSLISAKYQKKIFESSSRKELDLIAAIEKSRGTILINSLLIELETYPKDVTAFQNLVSWVPQSYQIKIHWLPINNSLLPLFRQRHCSRSVPRTTRLMNRWIGVSVTNWTPCGGTSSSTGGTGANASGWRTFCIYSCVSAWKSIPS